MTGAVVISWLQRLGDRINPILVKETRQALKSRQFSVTFLLLLAASLLVSFIGVALAGPDLDYQSAGESFFMAYFVVLALAVFVVVPFGAYRSLASEQEERTYELLSITTLRPQQIVAGKLSSACIQMFIYYSAIAPFMAFTVLLKGIDVLSVVFVLFFALLASLGFSMTGLLLASLSTRRSWQVFLSVVIVSGLLFATLMSLPTAFLVIGEMVPEMRTTVAWMALATFVMMYVTYFMLTFYLAAAQLTFEADNRSSRVRVVLVIQLLAAIAWIAYWWVEEEEVRDEPIALYTFSMVVCSHWFVYGCFLIAEPAGTSRRVGRQVPRSGLLRAVVTLFFPGPGTGLAFFLVNLICVVLAVGIGELSMGWLPTTVRARPPGIGGNFPTVFALASVSYLFFYVGLGALAVQIIRRWHPLPPIGGAAITLLITAMGSLIPSFFAAVLPGHRFGDYRVWQITDPITTLNQIYDMPMLGTLPGIPAGMAFLVFLLNLRTMAGAISEIHAAGRQAAAAGMGAATQREVELGTVSAAAEPAHGV